VPSDSGLGYLPNQDLALSPYHILTLPRGAQLTPECQALVEMASPPDSYEVYTTAISAAAVSTQIKAIESRLGLKARPALPACLHAAGAPGWPTSWGAAEAGCARGVNRLLQSASGDAHAHRALPPIRLAAGACSPWCNGCEGFIRPQAPLNV